MMGALHDEYWDYIDSDPDARSEEEKKADRARNDDAAAKWLKKNAKKDAFMKSLDSGPNGAYVKVSGMCFPIEFDILPNMIRVKTAKDGTRYQSAWIQVGWKTSRRGKENHCDFVCRAIGDNGPWYLSGDF